VQFAPEPLPRSLLVLLPGHPTLHKWSTIATTLAVLCPVPLSDLPADRGVTYERRRHTRTEAWPSTPNFSPGARLLLLLLLIRDDADRAQAGEGD
jgi:hypothetical protein